MLKHLNLDHPAYEPCIPVLEFSPAWLGSLSKISKILDLEGVLGETRIDVDALAMKTLRLLNLSNPSWRGLETSKNR